MVTRFLGAPEEPLKIENRARCAIFQGTVSIIGNIALAVLKFIFGWLTNSIALLADAFHTASDVLTSAIVIVGFKVAKRPADIKHPYGHGRIEPIATLIIALLLIWAGIEFAHASYDRLREPPRVEWSSVAFILMIVSTVFKEWMARFALAIGKMIESDMLKADAWHHRSDAGASALVAVSLLAAALGYERVDSVFGFCVAGLIIYTGFELLRSMINILLGEAPSRDLVDRIVKAGLSIRGVEHVHDINVHDYGHQRVVSLHVVIPGELETARSHHLAKLVEKAVGESVDASAVVHVDPSSSSRLRPSREVVEQTLRRLIKAHSEILRVEGLTVSKSQETPIVEFNIVMHGTLSLKEAHEIGRQVVDDLRGSIGDCDVNFHIEPEPGSG
jgi:cation diffusion facilitator family transporter